ncbi:MAG: Ig-like domain-containing protein, partial [Anaerovoracaceae bacterium]
ITVIFPDDQVQRTYKREIFLRPDAPLAENTTYRIAVDNTLKGKNENLIDNAHVVSFTTGTSTATALSENEKLTALSENVISYHTALAETENSVPLTKEELLDGRQEEGISLQAIALIAVLAIVLIAALFTVIALKKRKSQPKQAD